MTLNVNQPTDQIDIADLPSYIREDRAAINAVSGTGNVGVTELEVAAGASSIVVGTDVGTYGYEVVKISAVAAVTLLTMTGGTEGQVKKFIFQDNNITITDGVASNGRFYLNQLPALSNFSPQQNDVLEVVNIGGDGSTTHGYWKEVSRQIAVK